MARHDSIPSGRPRSFLVLVVGMVLGAGLVIGLGGLPGTASVDPADALGTMLDRDALERLEFVGRHPIRAGEISGFVETRSARGLVLMEVSIESAGSGELFVEFDPAALSPRGFNQEDPTSGEIHFAGDHYRLTHDGSNRYQLTFRHRATSDASLRVRVSDEQGAQQVVEIAVDPVA